MNVIIEKNKFDVNKIIFLDSVKNTVINNGYFYRLLYSDEYFSLNSIYFTLDIKTRSIDRYFNKVKFIFDIQQNEKEIKIFEKIENDLLKKMNIPKKKPVFKIKELFRNNFFKLFHNSSESIYSNRLLLKVSGIWETSSEYGITYKIIIV
jgi:hypothetical protein